jgi:hypothetical protein
MNTHFIFLSLILVEATLITIGGLIFSNILGENVEPYTQQSLEFCCNLNCTNNFINNINTFKPFDKNKSSNSTSKSEYLPFSDSVFLKYIRFNYLIF